MHSVNNILKSLVGPPVCHDILDKGSHLRFGEAQEGRVRVADTGDSRSAIIVYRSAAVP